MLDLELKVIKIKQFKFAEHTTSPHTCIQEHLSTDQHIQKELCLIITKFD